MVLEDPQQPWLSVQDQASQQSGMRVGASWAPTPNQGAMDT